MKTRHGNLGQALSSFSDEQKHKGATSGGNGPTGSAPAATPTGADNGTTIDFRSRSDTIGSLGLTLDDFRTRSETLGSAADVLADCLGPFPTVLDINVHALPPDQRQVYSANQAHLESRIHTAHHHHQQQHQQQQHQTSAPIEIKSSGGASGGGGDASRPSSHGSTSGFLNSNFGNATKKAAAASIQRAAGAGGTGSGGAGGIAHTPPSALGPASYEARHFGKRARAGSVSGRLRSASDLEDSGIIDRNQKGIIKDLIISGDNELQSALDRYEQGDKTALEAMIKSGRLQSYQATDGGSGSNIDILGDLDLDFLTMGGGHDDGLGAFIGQMEMEDAHPGSTGAANHPGGPGTNHPGAPVDGIGDLDFNADYGTTDDHLNLPTSGTSEQHRPLSIQAPAQGANEGRWRANSLAFGGLLNETPPQTPGTGFANWMDNPSAANQAAALASSGAVIDTHGGLIILNSNAGGAGGATKLTKKEEREQKKAAKDKAKKEKKAKKEHEAREKKAKKEERARRRSMSPKRSSKKDDKGKRRSVSPKTCRKNADAMDEDRPKEPTPSGLGLPRSMSDPNLRVGLDSDGLLCVESPEGWVGAYSPDSRKIRIQKFLAKRNHRVWTKKVKYDVRKNFADSRLRVKGRFVKKEDELNMRDLMSLT